MAKRNTEDMEIQAIKDHLSRQDKLLAEAKDRGDTLYRLISEINTLLGGSAALGVPGIRQDMKELKTDVANLKSSQSMRGKWLINISSIPGAIITILVIVGGLLGIIRTVVDLTTEPPKKESTSPKTNSYYRGDSHDNEGYALKPVDEINFIV